MNNQLKIVFCIPGNNFSGRFLESWTDLVGYCLGNNILPLLSCKQSCNIYYVRNMCLGADISRGKYQKPFNGEIEYDYVMWIDSDIVFKPEQFGKLLDHKNDIVSGIYLMDDGNHFATCKDWDEEYFSKHGHFKFLTLDDINLTQGLSPIRKAGGEIEGGKSKENEKVNFSRKEELIEVSYTGMGFMLVKKGVFESMEYPWFKPIEKKIGTMVDFTMEDVSFCLRAKENGFKIYVDPTVRVGHEKKIVL